MQHRSQLRDVSMAVFFFWIKSQLGSRSDHVPMLLETTFRALHFDASAKVMSSVVPVGFNLAVPGAIL